MQVKEEISKKYISFMGQRYYHWMNDLKMLSILFAIVINLLILIRDSQESMINDSVTSSNNGLKISIIVLKYILFIISLIMLFDVTFQNSVLSWKKAEVIGSMIINKNSIIYSKPKGSYFAWFLLMISNMQCVYYFLIAIFAGLGTFLHSFFYAFHLTLIMVRYYI